MSNAQLLDYDFTELRFYCETSAHPRTIHFKTANPIALQYVRGLGFNAVSAWNTDFVLLPGHDAWLPLSTIFTSDSPSLDERLRSRPFLDGDHNWDVGGSDNAFECDDSIGSPSATTLHQVWAR
jgi:hypothetical protein